jgi:hypothetical protein
MIESRYFPLAEQVPKTCFFISNASVSPRSEADVTASQDIKNPKIKTFNTIIEGWPDCQCKT